MTKHELIPAGPETAEPIYTSVVDAGSGDDLNLRELVNVWVRRRWLIIGSIAFGIVSAVLLVVFTKPVYEATATIEFNEESSGSLDLNLSSGMSSLGLGGGDLQTDLKTEIGVLTSDALAMKVIEKLNLAAQPPFVNSRHPAIHLHDGVNVSPSDRTHLLRTFKSDLKVKLVPDTRLIQVGFRSHIPAQSAEVANAVINSYKEMYLQTHYAAVSDASNWMTQQLSGLKTNVENSEKQLTDFEKANGILTVPTETALPNGGTMEGGQIHSPVIQRLDELNSELTAAVTDRVQKEAIYRLAAAGNPDVILGLEASPLAQGSSNLAMSGGRQSLDSLQGLESKRSDLLVAMAQGRAIYGPNNRHLKDLQTQLDAVNAQLQDEMRKIADRAGAALKVSQQTEDAIRGRFNVAEADAGRLNEKNVQLAILSQEASSQKQLYEDLYTKLQEADVSAGIKATNITVVDSADVPFIPVLPKTGLLLLMGVVGGAVMGFGGAHLMESFDNTIVSLPEIEEITGAAVLAVIPDFKASAPTKKSRGESLAQANALQGKQSTAWILNHPTSLASEAFRALRTGVLLSRPGGILKTLLVTSSVPGEGKSTVTFNLAVAMAQNGKKVIVVEADMRRPMMKRYIGVTSDIGLSSVVTDFAPLDEAIIRGVGTPNLDVLPAGPVPPLPAELLGSAKFDSVLAELRARYDVVLIDSPPALILTDAIAIAPKVDAVVWIVRAGTATRPHLIRAAQQVRRSRMPFIGYVLNGLDSRIDPYGYSYSYYGYNSKRYGAYYGEDSTSGE
jgi:succinoglycan biosynthesis transport protein ExoP